MRILLKVLQTADPCISRPHSQSSLVVVEDPTYSHGQLNQFYFNRYVPNLFTHAFELERTKSLSMAELAAAGSVVGLISLSIQSCQGLTSYYSAWKSYDEQISQTYRNVNELKILCESLGRELQRITHYQEPAVQQVNRLIASCQDGIKSLRDALDKCHSTQVPHNLATRIELHRVRALYPFKRQTLQSLRDTVDGIQRNLGTAVQILQMYVSSYYGDLKRLKQLSQSSLHWT